MLLYRLNHTYSFIRRIEINCFPFVDYFCFTVKVQSYFFYYLLSETHHPVVVLICYIDLHYSEFRVVGSVHTFVTEIFGKLIHSFIASHNKTFQVQFVGDPKVEWYIKRIVMGDERSCSGAARDGLKDRCFNFKITTGIE